MANKDHDDGSTNSLKVFISYSHEDNTRERPFVANFKKHITPFRDNGLIKDWYDREILPGEDYRDKIDNNLEDADIICLFISANFLDSSSCMKEKNDALELKKKKCVPVVPIILSPCLWHEYKEIEKLIALPTDGRPISDFGDQDSAWQDVCEGLKRIIDKENTIRQLELSEEFGDFLQDTVMLTKAHPDKEKVILDDVFVYPDLDDCGNLKEYEETVINFEDVIKNLSDYPRIVIAGEDQSGKTTLCKILFRALRERNFVPVYISDKQNLFRGKTKDIINRYLQDEYIGVDMNEIGKERIVPILDDFHYAKYKERLINDLTKYPHCILSITDIFSLDFKDEILVASFTYFRIRELGKYQRYSLVKNWVKLSDKKDSEIYKDIDLRFEQIDTILGKTFGEGILPAFPFYILLFIVSYEAFGKPLNREITSMGYCYQALLYIYFKKNKVKDDEIDMYLNFLTELAYYIFKNSKYELSDEELASFMKSYRETYNLPIKKDQLLKKLESIVNCDSLNNYAFCHKYAYYFFVAKYLAENLENDEIKQVINNIIQKLHVDENAYIAVFLSHHSKNVMLLEGIEKIVEDLFAEFDSVTLKKDEVLFLDKQEELIVDIVLPPPTSTPENERKKRMELEDEMERARKDDRDRRDSDRELPQEKELRRAIKSVEVIGGILKNRAGSLEKKKLEKMFLDGMNVILRILSNFFEIIKGEEGQEELIEYVKTRLKEKIEKSEEEGKELSDEQLRKQARTFLMNLYFLFICGCIHKTTTSLGSDKLIPIVKKVCDDVGTPASFLVKHGILMWYNKYVAVDEMAGRVKMADFSAVARKALKLFVVNHVYLHPTNRRARQKIHNQLKIPQRTLLKGKYKTRKK